MMFLLSLQVFHERSHHIGTEVASDEPALHDDLRHTAALAVAGVKPVVGDATTSSLVRPA